LPSATADRRWLYWLPPLLAVAVRALWAARIPVAPLAPVDAEGFHLLAINWLAGRGLALAWEPPFCPDTLRTPLYPLWVAGGYRLLGPDPARIVWLHWLLEALTTALVMRLGREVGDARVGLGAGLCYALNGSTQRYTGVLYSETLLLTALTAALWLTARVARRPRPGRAALAGVGWGLALLVKPNAQYLALAAGGWLALAGRDGRQRLRLGLAFGVAMGAALAPWLLRNHALLGRATLSTAFQENLARVSVVATLAEAQGIAAEPWTPTWEALYTSLADAAGERHGWTPQAALTLPCPERELRRAQLATVAREIVLAHPAAFVRGHLRGVARSLRDLGYQTWYPALTGRTWASTGRVADLGPRLAASLRIGAVGDALHALWLERVLYPPLDAFLLWWGLLAGRIAVAWLALRGWRRLGWRAPLAWLLVGAAAYFILLPGPIAYDRFYLPAIPAVVVLFTLGGCWYNGEGMG